MNANLIIITGRKRKQAPSITGSGLESPALQREGVDGDRVLCEQRFRNDEPDRGLRHEAEAETLNRARCTQHRRSN